MRLQKPVGSVKGEKFLTIVTGQRGVFDSKDPRPQRAQQDSAAGASLAGVSASLQISLPNPFPPLQVPLESSGHWDWSLLTVCIEVLPDLRTVLLRQTRPGAGKGGCCCGPAVWLRKPLSCLRQHRALPARRLRSGLLGPRQRWPEIQGSPP